jgi:hypothetical protein
MKNLEQIVPPRLKDSKKNLQQIAVTATSQVVAVDAQVRNRRVRIRSTITCAIYFRPDDAGSVDQTLATSVGSDSATLGYQLAANVYEDFDLGGQDNYIVVDGSATGTLQILGRGPQRIVDGASQGP